MDDESVIDVRIRENYALLSKSEKRIGDFVLDHPNAFVNATAKEVADRTKTSAATVVRFSRMLGFEGISDMKRFLLLTRPRQAERKVIAERSENTTLKQRTFEYNEECTAKVYEQLDDGLLQAAVKKLMSAHMVYLIGIGGSGSSLQCAYDAFLKIGLPCNLIKDPFFQVMTLSGAKEPKKNVVLCICHSGRVKDIQDTLEIAKKRGMTTISMVGYRETPLKKFTDIQILTGANEHPVFSDTMAARICELNVLSVIYATIVQQMGDKYADIRNAVNDSINMKRLK